MFLTEILRKIYKERHKKMARSKSKSQVIKSKSSNTAMREQKARKARRHKTLSNVEFPPHGSKKRGVYVEKKSKMGIRLMDKGKAPEKPPRVPRRDRKGFLTSVMGILGKYDTPLNPQPSAAISSAGSAIDVITHSKSKLKPPKTAKSTAVTNNTTQPSDSMVKLKKTKYRSKILNQQNYNLKENVVVLKPNKSIINTPSNSSYKGSAVQSKLLDYLNSPIVLASQEQSRHTEITVPKSTSKTNSIKKQTLHNEPTTVVSETNAKDETKIYNFFVDLIETTLDVYGDKDINDAKDRTPANSPSVAGSKTNLEIDEVVAKKLNKPKVVAAHGEKSDVLKKKYDVTDKTIEGQGDKAQAMPPTGPQQAVHVARARSPKSSVRFARYHSPASRRTWSPNRSPARSWNWLKTPSYEYSKPHSRNEPTESSQEFVWPKSQSKKKPSFKKMALLNILKEQLQMEADAFAEPVNMHEALQIMAQNKRRCRRALRFDDTAKRAKNEYPDSECWKRRRVLSQKGAKPKRNTYYDERDNFKSYKTSVINRSNATHVPATKSMYTATGKNSVHTNLTSELDNESYHSIEVTEYVTIPDPSFKLIRDYSENIPHSVYHPSHETLIRLAQRMASGAHNIEDLKSISQIMLSEGRL